MQAARTVRRDMCAYMLPSTLLRLLSLGPDVLPVAEILRTYTPFSAASTVAYKRLINVIMGSTVPSETCASVRLNTGSFYSFLAARSSHNVTAVLG